ncbi:sensor domain-containing diguanylate cyclase [Fusibacter tunisiensis]|uniref:Diguanylate cyclase (GGDEF)-like protein/PAS domain S-box-containing protein n=1 Tax=Fusibacter tunisiensis TaxID=1008308 RepID=A0ABS2MUC5_9FIRM|nr:diguanylate cyclase [Fusibacter tunisiensis]MBM7563034.1 diguanylate cyclase (GGDEF)-like protein/PAS domain S-box-containing protein [Fusibacter tunisiensis]
MGVNSNKIINYVNTLLNDATIPPEVPNELRDVEGIFEIDHTIRNLRQAIKLVGNGDLSEQLIGKGYLMGTVKSLQATLRNLIWQTKSISEGDFSHRVDFLGEFSDSFNSMARKLQQTISDLNDARALFELFFDTIPDATMIVSSKNLELFNCNQAFADMIGLSKNEILGCSLEKLRIFSDENQLKVFKRAISETDHVMNLSINLGSSEERTIYGLLSTAVIWINNEKYILSVIKNVTELKLLENKLRESEERHRLIADNASDVIWTMDLNGRFTYLSPSVEKFRGYTVEEVMKQSKEELLCPDSLALMEKGLEDAIYYVQNNLPIKVFRGDMEQPCKDGSTVWTDLTVSGIYDKEGQFLGMLGVSRNITDRKKMEEEITRLTEVDRLTGLYNRYKLDAVLKSEIERSRRSDSVFSIILLDIDDFKKVNDGHGHIIGDSVLKEFSEIIKSSIRKNDTAGRWGGEEFMIILPDSDCDGGMVLAEKLRAKINEHKFDAVTHMSASFGVASFEKEISGIELVARADNAMYRAKRTGKNKVCR